MLLELALALFDLCASAEPGAAYFHQHGIDAVSIRQATGGVFLSPIRVIPPKFFEPDPAGKLVAWCEARNEFQEVVDVVAWSIRKPEKVVTLLGRGTVLGAEWAADPVNYFGKAPLPVFRTPLQWLQSGCDGVCLLDAMRGARWLIDVPTDRIAAEDDQLAREIVRARQSLMDRQSIVVPQRKRQANREAA